MMYQNLRIATVLNVHGSKIITTDVLDSIRAWATRNIILIVDGASWDQYSDFQHPDTVVVKGLYHRAHRSPYKNMAIGLREAYTRWPDMHWYNYIEYDVLYLNDNFKMDLAKALNGGFAAVGFNHQPKFADCNDHWVVKDIFQKDEIACHKLLGAITFYSNNCLDGWSNVNFLDEVLEKTKDFEGADFPNFGDYAVEEILFPSAASLFGHIGNLSPRYNGGGPYYKVRFHSEVNQNEIKSSTSLIHPLKTENNPIREHFRCSREIFLE